MVNGSKNFITHAIHADTCVAMAVTDQSQTKQGHLRLHLRKGNEGFCAFEEGEQAGTAGVGNGERSF